MASPYICSTCRTRLAQAKPRISRLLSNSAYTQQQQRPGIGLFLDRHVGAGRNVRPRQHEPDSNSGSVARGRYSGKELKPEELLGQVDNPLSSRTAGEGQRRRPPRPQYIESDDIQRQTYKSVPTRSRQTPGLQRAQQFVSFAQSQQWMQAWAALQDACEQLLAGDRHDARPFFREPGFEPAMRNLLHFATKEWLGRVACGSVEATQPSPVDILTLLYTLNVSKASLVRPCLWQASSGLAELHSRKFSGSENDPTFVGGLRSLVDMWRIVMATYSRRGSSDPSPPIETLRWDFLPSATVFDQQIRRSRDMFEQMFGMLVPMPQLSASAHTNSRNALRSMDFASPALVTLDLLRSLARSHSALLSEPEISPFANLLNTMLKIAPAPRTPFSFQEKLSLLGDPALLVYYQDMGSRLNFQDMRLRSPDHVSEAAVDDTTTPSKAASAEDDLEPEPQSSVSHTDRFALVNAKRLKRALEKQDMLLAEKIKRETYAFAGSHGADTQALPLELYEHLMLTFLSLRNPKTAIEVWNHVIQAGYTPTVKTYSTMVSGAQAVRDASGMKAFWQKMRKAGLQPDEHAWSIRIYGLFKLQLVKEGFQAMNEMSQEWLAAAKSHALRGATREQKKQMATNQNLGGELLAKYQGPVDDVPRPNLVVVNSAISSLAQGQRGDIPKALTWARTFGVEPDLTTYNVLLNVAMRYEQTDEALKILRRMQQRGIAADSTTWTVLLTALFEGGFLEGLDHKQQEEKVLAFINSLKTGDPNTPGIDTKGYALVMDRLLKHHNNPSGAAAVMKHMMDRGHEPTTYIYTILMSSYFQRQPEPDLAAVEALWKQIESQNSGYGAPVDSVFYDRVVEGYATHHRLAGLKPMLDFLRRCRQAGQKPGWRALEMVARALAERQEWNRLKALVDDVRTSLRESRGASQHMGQRNFWRFIIEDVGLLREEGITKPEDILPKNIRQSPLLQAEANAASA